MNDKKYLNEEKYQKTEKSISLLAIIILVLGLSLGGFLIYRGVAKPGKSKVEKFKTELEMKKTELENKGVEHKTYAKYTDGEVYDLYIITQALDPSFDHCAFDEYKNNSITKEYCSAKNSISEFTSTSSIMFGAFICIATIMISGSIFSISKRRKILAFGAQQIMPVGKEVIEEVAPTIGKATASMAKEVAPVYGNIAKEIAKGVKEGIKEDSENE